MPVKDGWEATLEIREREQRGLSLWVPIVAVTGNTDHGDRERCLGAGMDAYMSKPVQSRAVLQLVKHWVAMRKARQREADAQSESSFLLPPRLVYVSPRHLFSTGGEKGCSTGSRSRI